MPRAALLYCEQMMDYDFGRGHPLRPIRLRMTAELIRSYGLLDLPDSQLITPRPVTETELLLAHDGSYIEAIRALSRNPDEDVDPSFGFYMSDNPPFAGMYESSLLYTGASAQAAEMVMRDEVDVSFSIAGGLHHARRARASGFCIFNDAVVAVRRLQEKFGRILYIDIDAHHGDGVQEAFYDTDEVMTISIHESGRWLFPGSGFVEEMGTGKGTGFSINAPLAPGSGDAEAVRVYDSAIQPLIDAYAPQVVVAQLGVDGHFADPLAHLAYTSIGWLELVRRILSLGKPVVALGGGGYDARTVCRLWTLAYALMLNQHVPDDIPNSFAETYRVCKLNDNFEPQMPVSEQRKVRLYADDTIRKIQQEIFPLHRIDTAVGSE